LVDSTKMVIFATDFMKKLLYIPLFFILFASCEYVAEHEVQRAATSFGKAYFSWHLRDALPLTTPESHEWISFAASQLRDTDIAVIKHAGDVITEIDECVVENDTLASVRLRVQNFCQADTLGKPVRRIDEAYFRFPLVKREDKWLVRMVSPLRSEKKNRD